MGCRSGRGGRSWREAVLFLELLEGAVVDSDGVFGRRGNDAAVEHSLIVVPVGTATGGGSVKNPAVAGRGQAFGDLLGDAKFSRGVGDDPAALGSIHLASRARSFFSLGISDPASSRFRVAATVLSSTPRISASQQLAMSGVRLSSCSIRACFCFVVRCRRLTFNAMARCRFSSSESPDITVMGYRLMPSSRMARSR